MADGRGVRCDRILARRIPCHGYKRRADAGCHRSGVAAPACDLGCRCPLRRRARKLHSFAIGGPPKRICVARRYSLQSVPREPASADRGFGAAIGNSMADRKAAKDWEALARKELRERSLESLTWRAPDGFDVKPLYTAADLENIETDTLPGLA